MDKRVVFAVAGSGKTTLILSKLDLERRSLIITYTVNNVENLRNGIIRKFGYFPANIKLMSYFNFLYGFCFRPFLAFEYKARGINWNINPNQFAKDDARYIDSNRRLYSNRLAKFLEKSTVLKAINLRIEKYYDYILFDEIQDLAGHDFNLLKSIAKSKLNMLCVGDFFQHTFDTGRDGSVNRKLHDDYYAYQRLFKDMGLIVDTTSLVKSYRCSPEVCEFVSKEIGIDIQSQRTDQTHVEVIDDEETALNIYLDDSVVKLFYMDQRKYSCFAKNWGETKGEDRYRNVCVVLNEKSWKILKNGKLEELAPTTKNKFYVACTRAKGNLYLVSEAHYKLFKKGKKSQ